MTQNGKIIPNLDQERTKQMNLTVLQRLDPFVEEVLMTAAHVTLYEFNADINQWSRKDVEGSLFVVKRNEQPRFQFIVMNRRSTENLVEDLLGDFEYEIQSPYLLYRNGAQEVNGIWFYNAQDCEAVANLFSRILNAFSKVPPKSVASIKSEFEELEAVPSIDVIEGPLEPQRSTSVSVPDVSDGSFLNFFNTAMNMGNTSNMSNTVQKNPASTSMPVPSYTLKEIEHPIPILQSQPSLQTSSNPLLPLLDAHKSSARNNHATNLVNPSLFSSSSSSSSSSSTPSLIMPPIQIQSSVPAVTMQQPYGTPLLQPFPPPTPPPYLTPAPSGPVITKDKVRDALLRLVKTDQFIDMVYQELLNAHKS